MTLYDVLELEADASVEDVRRAYRKLALRWHPGTYHIAVHSLFSGIK